MQNNQSAVTTTNDTKPTTITVPPLQRVKQAKARKAGTYSQGEIEYVILRDQVSKDLYISVIANDSSGQFSKEAISVASIEQYLAIQKMDQIEASAKILAPLYRSKSTNNAGFLMAVLLAEGLMRRDTEKDFAYLQIGDWKTWQATYQQANAIPEPITVSAEDTPLTTAKTTTTKSTTKAKETQHDRDQTAH